MKKYVLGIDPSSSSTGYAVLDIETKKVVDYGRIKAKADCPEEFYSLGKSLSEIYDKYKITHVGCENQFIHINKSAGIKATRPTGIVLYFSGMHGIKNDEFNFFAPASWRKLFNPLNDKDYSKKHTFELVNLRYPEFELKSFNADNDKADAIGIAHATYKFFYEENK